LTKIARNTEAAEAVVVSEAEVGVDTEGEEQTCGEDDLLEWF
jgi:hypothetical protein